MTWTLIASVSAPGAGGVNPVTTGAIDTTGADLLVVVQSVWNAGTPALEDSKSNSWTTAVDRDPGSAAPQVKISYCQAPTVGSGHTFTTSGLNTYGTICVLAYSGSVASPLDQTNGADTAGDTTLATGSVTPTEDGELLIAGLCDAGGSSVSIGSSFTIRESEPYSGGVNMGGYAADFEQGSAGALNPTWSWSGSVAATAAIATFKGEASAPASIHQGLHRIEFGAVRSLHAIEAGLPS